MFGFAGAHGDVADGLAESLQRDGLSILEARNLEACALSLAPGSRRISRPLARVGSCGSEDVESCGLEDVESGGLRTPSLAH